MSALAEPAPSQNARAVLMLERFIRYLRTSFHGHMGSALIANIISAEAALSHRQRKEELLKKFAG